MSTQTFKAGDKVTHGDSGRSAEVKFGPFASSFGADRYMVQFDGSDYLMQVIGSNLTLRPAFQVGDKVTVEGADTTIAAGPFVDDDGSVTYVAKSDYGDHELYSADVIKPVPAVAPLKPGDKIRILKGDLQRANVSAGDVLTVQTVDYDGNITTNAPRGLPDYWYFGRSHEGTGWERVTTDTETYDGVTYDLSARYRDEDGDYWTFKRIDGTVRGNCAGTNRAVEVSEYSEPLSSAVRNFGPLMRVEG